MQELTVERIEVDGVDTIKVTRGPYLIGYWQPRRGWFGAAGGPPAGADLDELRDLVAELLSQE